PEGEAVEVVPAHPSRRLDPALVAATVQRVLDGEGFAARAVSIVLTDHATVLDLNRAWLDHDYTTDVLSFNLDEDALAEHLVEGEVYVDLDTAAERAPEFGTTFEAEAVRYVVHGVLHLVGYNDATSTQRAAMRVLEDRYLQDVARGT
ncbi:MAG: rRNA maturation RNase YbeY, partial [Bacteroidota bacterium]